MHSGFAGTGKIRMLLLWLYCIYRRNIGDKRSNFPLHLRSGGCIPALPEPEKFMGCTEFIAGASAEVLIK